MADRHDALYQQILESMRDVVFTLDREMRHTGVFGRWIEEAGLTPEDFLGKTFAEILGETAATVHEREFARALAGEFVLYEWNLPTEEGTQYFQTSLSPIYDEAGAATGLVGIGRDITELKGAQTMLANIIEATEVGTWQWNVKTGSVVFNERWATMVGYTLDDLEPLSIETWLAFLHPEDKEPTARALERHFSGEMPFYDVEVRMRHRDGYWIWIQDRGKVISRDGAGNPVMMFGTHTDITTRKTASRRIEELLEEKTLILREINHRTKNNLAMVASLIHLKEAELGAGIDLSDLQSRVSTLSALHERLQYSGGTDRVAILPYFRTVLDAVFTGSAIPVTLSIDVEDRTFRSRTATSLGLILNELATNAVKHGFVPAATEEAAFSVTLARDEGSENSAEGTSVYTLTISNSGVSLPETIDTAEPASMGFQLVGHLANQLGGSFTVTGRTPPEFTITFHVRE